MIPRILPSSESFANDKMPPRSVITAVFCRRFQEAPRGGDSMLPNLKQKKQKTQKKPKPHVVTQKAEKVENK